MTTYTPSEIAKGDQHYAMVAANLDDIIETYTAHRGKLDRVPALDSMTRFFAGLLPTPDGVDPRGADHHAGEPARAGDRPAGGEVMVADQPTPTRQELAQLYDDPAVVLAMAVLSSRGITGDLYEKLIGSGKRCDW